MARRNRRILKTKKNKVIQKNLVRNTLIILILIVFLFVIYRFNFSTKSELVDAIKVNFKEYGENISLENSEMDLEVFTDSNGEKYIILPEKINGYYVNQYYITNNKVQDTSEEKNTTIVQEITNTVINNQEQDNIDNQTNSVVNEDIENLTKSEEIAGLKKQFLTSKDLGVNGENSDLKEDDENTNTILEEKVDTTTNEIVTDNKVIEENKTLENTVIEEDTISNEIEDENQTVESKVETETTISEKTEYNTDTVIEKEGVKPGSKFTVKEVNGQERYSIGDVTIEVEYQTILVGNTQLYKQELTFEENDTKFVADGYIPVGYSLNAIAINKSQEEIQDVEIEIRQTEDFKEFHPIFAYNIIIEKDGEVYEPTEYAPTINIKTISTYLNNVKNELNVKLVRFKNDNIALMSLEDEENTSSDVIEQFKDEDVKFGFDSIEIETDKFTEYTYVAIAEDICTEEQITIDTYESDRNFYLGKNYTDNKDGNNSGKYSDDNLAKVTVNYHSIPESSITGSENLENKITDITVTSVRESITGMPSKTADCRITIEVNSDVEVSSNWKMQVTFKDTRYTNSFDIVESSEYKKIDYRTFELSSSAGNQLINNKIEVIVRVEGTSVTPSTAVLALTQDSVNFFNIENYDYQLSQVSASISADGNETQNLVSYKTCLPIVDGKISFELIDNPFMDRPVATKTYLGTTKPEEKVLLGFDGWKNSAYTISINDNTKVQKAEIPVSSESKEITVDLYADWKEANVVFMKQGGAGDGRAIGTEVGSWSNAISKLNESPKYASNASDRELNIIVVTGGTIEDTNSTAFSNANVGYTVTSIFDGHDYRQDGATIALNHSIDNLNSDLQMAFLNITGSGNYNENNPKDFTDYDTNSKFKYYISGNSYNLRIGRGMMPLNASENTTTFAQVQGGGGDQNLEYKTVIESGKYSNIYVEDGRSDTLKNRQVLGNLVLGSDYDKALNNNEDLNVYYRVLARYRQGIISTISDSENKIYDICVKSGRIGIDLFEQYNELDSQKPNASITGIMVAGTTSGDNTNQSYDKGDRVLIIEGGQIANITGGLCVNPTYSNLSNTYIYVKGSGANIQYISAGSVQTSTAGDRILQVTDGIVQYSITGGINGYESASGAGILNSNTLVYIGGNAAVGGDDRLINKKYSPTQDTIYGLEYGNVLAAGNGRNGYQDVGKVNSSHVIIDGNAQILNNVYGGGNFGKVAQNSKVDILGGTIGGNVFGGSNQNGVDGNVEINMKNGTVDGAVYGGSNQNGTISGNAKITVSGGTINSNADGDAIFIGGVGQPTQIDGITELLITNDSNDVNINGNIYGGSQLGAINNTSYVRVKESSSNNKINISGNIFGAGKGSDRLSATNKDVNVAIDGGTYDTLQVFGGANINGFINGNITVKIGETIKTYVNEVYGGGNNAEVRCTDNKAYKNEMYLYENAEVRNAFNGGNNAGIEERRQLVAMYVNGEVSNIYGGSNSAGNVGETQIKCEGSENLGNIYGGGLGENTTVQKTTVELINSNAQNVYGGGELGSINGETFVRINSSTINGSAFAAGKGDSRDSCNKALVKGPTTIIAEGTTVIENNLFGGGDAANIGAIGDTSTDPISGADSYVYISGATIKGSVYGGSNQARVFGNANIFIGKSAITEGYEQGKIEIDDTIFGGGESRSGSDIFDYSFKSINGNININIDGTDYDISEENTINIKGSVFGSGNASSAAKDGDITIKNYGSMENVKNGISIQRATDVVIDNSFMQLEGTTDSTNTYFKDVAYTFNIVENLKIKNGTVLYLKNGANRLSNFYSMVDKDGEEVTAEVTFSEDGRTVNKNVDNRLYLYNGSNLNISAREDVQGDYGYVEGMTFFGVYQGDLYSGIYDVNYEIGKAPEWSERNFTSSYVLGLHQRNPEHDITKNGFYTAYETLTPEADKLQKENNLTSDQYESTGSYYGYIEPTPKDYQYYAWYTGLNKLKRIEITADSLIVTNYSTLGAVDVSLKELDAIKKNGTLSIEEFTVNWEDANITLVDKSEIENISEDANTKFALAMKTGNIGWASEANTNFKYEDDNSYFTGDKQYTFENADTTTTVGLYLYHSKNIEIEDNKKLGTGEILMNLTYMEGPNLYTVEVVIHLSMSMQLDKDSGYNAAITPGVKYDLFTTSATDITTESSFSTFLELSQRNFRDREINGSVKNDEYYEKLSRILNTGYELPSGTTITMVDLSKNNEPRFYYYRVKTPQNEFYLKDFIAMGSKDGNNKELYDETLMNSRYYDANLKFHYEAFIFIVDFKDVDFPEGESAKITEDPEITIELHSEQLRDDNGVKVPELNIGLISSQLSSHRTKYNIYRADSQNGVSISPRIQNLYVGNTSSITVGTSFSTEQVDGATPTNTQYFNKKLGAVVTLTKDGRPVQGSELLGTWIEIDGSRYHPRSDGTIRVNLNEIVANVSKRLTINATNSSLASGAYKLSVKTFASADGKYYGTEKHLAEDVIDLNIVNNRYGLNSKIPDNQSVIDCITGRTLDEQGYSSRDEENSNILDVQLDYNSTLTTPYITVSLERREYGEKDEKTLEKIYSRNYKPVDLADYVELISEDGEILTKAPKEITDSGRIEYEAVSTEMIKNISSSIGDATFNFKYKIKPPADGEKLVTGTYRLVFTLYDISQEEREVVINPDTNTSEILPIIPGDTTTTNTSITRPDITYETVTVYKSIGDVFSYIIIK